MPKFNDDILNKIYDKTDGCCHICHRKLSFKNYGINMTKGAWHVEHSKPKAKGGSDHLNNLYPACIACNLDKGTTHTKNVRSSYGVNRAPYSAAKKQKIREENELAGLVSGLIAGAKFGPAGAIIGSIAGLLAGSELSPKR